MKKIFAPIALGSAALLLVACGDDGNNNATTNNATETTQTTTEVDGTEETETEEVVEGVGMTAAIDAALADEPGEVVHAEETDDKYHVHVRPAEGDKAVEVEVNRETGEVEEKRDRDLSEHEREATAVTAAQAVETAQGEVEGNVHRVELTEDHDRDAAETDDEGHHDSVRVWEVTVQDAADDDRHEVVHIDAETGEVLEVTR